MALPPLERKSLRQHGFSLAQVGSGLTVAAGGTLPITVLFTYPGRATPTGAISITGDNSTSSLTTPASIFKAPAAGEHTHCSITYTTPSAAGNHTLRFRQSADRNDNAFNGTATISVIQSARKPAHSPAGPEPIHIPATGAGSLEAAH